MMNLYELHKKSLAALLLALMALAVFAGVAAADAASEAAAKEAYEQLMAEHPAYREAVEWQTGEAGHSQ